MSKKLLFLYTFAVLAAGIWYLWPRIFFMRDFLPGREHEDGLPKISIEKGNVVYCRMKADDFRFRLPDGARPRPAVIERGGFDSVYGAIDVELKNATASFAREYTESLARRVPMGGHVTAEFIADGLRISFSYFGDR